MSSDSFSPLFLPLGATPVSPMQLSKLFFFSPAASPPPLREPRITDEKKLKPHARKRDSMRADAKGPLRESASALLSYPPLSPRLVASQKISVLALAAASRSLYARAYKRAHSPRHPPSLRIPFAPRRGALSGQPGAFVSKNTWRLENRSAG